MTYCDFGSFLKNMSTLDYFEIITKAEQEVTTIERSSYSVKGAVERRKMGSIEYARKIKEFLFFMRYGQKPSGINEEDFKLYQEVVEALIRKEQFDPSILKMFNEDKTE